MSPGGPGGTAGPSIERLLRLLQLIPAATREGGVSFDDMARRLDVDRATIERDVRELLDRSAYLRPGHAGVLQAEVGAERISIWTPGPFARPPRLRPEEALALALGLRSRALLRGRSPEAESRALLTRMEGALGEGGVPEREHLPIEDASADHPGGALRDRALDAVAEQKVLRLLYLKPGASEAEWRRLEPAAVVHAEAHWYLLGRDPEAGGVRAFRMDRVLELEHTRKTFEPVEHPDLRELEGETRVYLPPDEGVQEIPVVYSARIARWIRERYECEGLADGSVRVIHRVSDPEWLVRHVVQYGGEARAEGSGAAWVRDALEGRCGGRHRRERQGAEDAGTSD